MTSPTNDSNVEGGQVDTSPITSDHMTLRALMDRMGGMLAKLVAHDMSNEAEMLQLVKDFRRLLLTHFDREEESGVLERAAEHAPRFANQVDALLGEHAKIRTGIDALCEEAPGPSWSDFEVRFGAFCETLAAHEQAENEILQDAYLDDLGGHN